MSAVLRRPFAGNRNSYKRQKKFNVGHLLLTFAQNLFKLIDSQQATAEATQHNLQSCYIKTVTQKHSATEFCGFLGFMFSFFFWDCNKTNFIALFIVFDRFRLDFYDLVGNNAKLCNFPNQIRVSWRKWLKLVIYSKDS